MTSLLRYGHKLASLRTSTKRQVLRSPIYSIIGGVILGFLLGYFFYVPAASDYKALRLPVELHANENITDPNLLYIRCVLLLKPHKTELIPNVIPAIRETYASFCNETVYFTNDEDISNQAKNASLDVKFLNISASNIEWDFFLNAMEKSSKKPASWTIFLDDHNFLVVHNLRKLVSRFDSNEKLMFARAFAGNSTYERFFNNIRIELPAGVVLSAPAIRHMGYCFSSLFPMKTESALYPCAVSCGVSVFDPIDEEGKHLFNNIDIKTATHKSYQEEKKAKNEEVDCCSDHAITFGHHSHPDIRTSFFASSVLNIFGTAGTSEKDLLEMSKDELIKANVTNLVKK